MKNYDNTNDNHWDKDNEKSGMEPIPGYAENRPCNCSEHNPPMYIYIPPGMQYRHVCPQCKKVIIMRGNDVTCSTN